MGVFKVEKNDFPVPPSDSYFLDLVWIESVEYSNGPAYKWHFKIADIETQNKLSDCFVSALTSRVPTMKNRFGKFLDVLNGGLEVGGEGTTEELCLKSFRVKGFVKQSDDAQFANVDSLIEKTAEVGKGCGISGAYNKLKEVINEYLGKAGKPLLKLEEKASVEKTSTGSKEKTGGPSGSGKPKADIPWAFVGPVIGLTVLAQLIL
jgi:hypothetical protein